MLARKERKKERKGGKKMVCDLSNLPGVDKKPSQDMLTLHTGNKFGKTGTKTEPG